MAILVESNNPALSMCVNSATKQYSIQNVESEAEKEEYVSYKTR